MDSFQEQVKEHQDQWFKDNLTGMTCEYKPWILPKKFWAKALWGGIREGANSLPEYINKKAISFDRFNNLKSSWVLCANLYFPFLSKNDMALLTGFLKEHVSRKIEKVEAMHLEYQDYNVIELLGELRGKGGKYQTTPDVALIVKTTKGKGLILIESKYAETDFDSCPGATKYNTDLTRCTEWKDYKTDLNFHPQNLCFLREKEWKEKTKQPNRKYWEHLQISEKGKHEFLKCPAAKNGYQLLRQQALAEAILNQGKYDFVFSCVAYDRRNDKLIKCLNSTGIEDFTKGWGSMFNGKSGFVAFSHQDWVTWVAKNDKGNWKDWLSYVKSRYDY